MLYMLAFTFLFGTLLVTDVTYRVEPKNEHVKYENANRLKEQIATITALNEIHTDQYGTGTSHIRKQGVPVSNFIIYDENTSYQDGFMLNRYESAVEKYFELNPNSDDPTCTQLKDTNFITLADCEYIEAKDIKLINVTQNGVDLEINDELGETLAAMHNSYNKNGGVYNFSYVAADKKAQRKRIIRKEKLIRKFDEAIKKKDYLTASNITKRMLPLSISLSKSKTSELVNKISLDSSVSTDDKKIIADNSLEVTATDYAVKNLEENTTFTQTNRDDAINNFIADNMDDISITARTEITIKNMFKNDSEFTTSTIDKINTTILNR